MQADVHFIAHIVGGLVGDGHDIRTPSTIGRQDCTARKKLNEKRICLVTLDGTKAHELYGSSVRRGPQCECIVAVRVFKERILERYGCRTALHASALKG
jgi:hypothetical protein